VAKNPEETIYDDHRCLVRHQELKPAEHHLNFCGHALVRGYASRILIFFSQTPTVPGGQSRATTDSGKNKILSSQCFMFPFHLLHGGHFRGFPGNLAPFLVLFVFSRKGSSILEEFFSRQLEQVTLLLDVPVSSEPDTPSIKIKSNYKERRIRRNSSRPKWAPTLLAFVVVPVFLHTYYRWQSDFLRNASRT